MNKYIRQMIDNKYSPYSRAFQEPLYFYYKSENYEYKSLIELSDILEIRINLLKSYIYSYAEKYLVLTKSEFDTLRKQDREKNKETFIGIENIILEKYGINTKFLYNNEGEKELLLMELYKYSSSNKFSVKSTKEMASKLNISETKYLKLVKEYMDNYINKNSENIVIPEDELSRGDRVRINNKKLTDLYNKIINYNESDDISELALIIDNSGYNISSINENFYLYHKFYTKEQIKAFEKNYSLYREYRTKTIKEKREALKKEREQAKLKKELSTASIVINDYLETTDLAFPEFLVKNNITKEQFNNYIKSLEINNKELYNEYLNKRDDKESEYESNLNRKIEELGDGLINGYEENGKKRNFDIIDYFRITSIPLSNILAITNKKLNNKQFYLLKKLKTNFLQSEKFNSTNIKAIMEEKRVVGIQFDKFGKIIEGTGKEITIEEKEKIIKYLEKNNIPFNRMTYNAVLKRYIDEFINLDNEKTLKLINN